MHCSHQRLIFHTVTRQRRRIPRHVMNVVQQRYKATSVFEQITIPSSVRESVKTSFLNEAVREDSRLWKYGAQHVTQQSSSSPHHETPHILDNNKDCNESTMDVPDPLHNLIIKDNTRYWPNLPSCVSTSVDPFALAKPELDTLAESIRGDLIGTDHAVLNMAASYFFEASNDGGKKVRPMLVLLLSRALADSMSHSLEGRSAPQQPPLFPLFTEPCEWQRRNLPQLQRRLAEISEMIHTASLFHDDVIDGADTRRGKRSAHHQFGNKMAILAGDYLLARASIFLARLRNVEVIETMSTIIEHLVRGEVMQLRGNTPEERSSDRLSYYLRKNFYKTGSLMANSCKSAALLGNYPDELVDISYRYGKHVGMAFQLVDDVLDFEGSVSQLGKPALSDLTAGLATAPVLFAAEHFPEMNVMIERKFKGGGDIDHAVDLVFQCPSPTILCGIDRTKELARLHAEYAMDAILELEASQHRDALVQLAYAVVARTK